MDKGERGGNQHGQGAGDPELYENNFVERPIMGTHYIDYDETHYSREQRTDARLRVSRQYDVD